MSLLIYVFISFSTLFGQQQDGAIQNIDNYYKQIAMITKATLPQPEGDKSKTILEQSIGAGQNIGREEACYQTKKDVFDSDYSLFMLETPDVNETLENIIGFLKIKGYVKKFDSEKVFKNPETICEGNYNCISSTFDVQYLANKTRLESWIIDFTGHVSNLIKDPANNKFIIVDFYYSAMFAGKESKIVDGDKKAEYFLKILTANQFCIFKRVSIQTDFFKMKKNDELTTLFSNLLNNQEFNELKAQYQTYSEKLESLQLEEAEEKDINTMAKKQTSDIIIKKMLDDIMHKELSKIEKEKKPLKDEMKNIELKTLELMKTLSPELI